MMRRGGAAATILGLLLTACGGGEGGPQEGTAVRETLANGATLVRYTALPDPADTLETDLRIGTLEGDEAYIFGDVRGIEATRDGDIYVLDAQASEVRRYDAEGRFVEVMASRGEGPDEIQEANGFQISGDSLLWVQDYGRWRMFGIGLNGHDNASAPVHVRSRSYVWAGAVDDSGVFWKRTVQLPEDMVFPPPEGLIEVVYRMYMKSYDPHRDATDSVYVGESRSRSFVEHHQGGGYMMQGIPFDPAAVFVTSPAGDIWTTEAREYRVARLTPEGDTALVLQVDEPAPPVTEGDRQAFLAAAEERGPEQFHTATEVLAAANETKAPIDQISFDDAGRIWIRRVSGEGEPRRYDIFQADGSYVTSVTLGFEPMAYLPLRIRHGSAYARVHDDMNVPYVVRAPLPEGMR